MGATPFWFWRGCLALKNISLPGASRPIVFSEARSFFSFILSFILDQGFLAHKLINLGKVLFARLRESLTLIDF